MVVYHGEYVPSDYNSVMLVDNDVLRIQEYEDRLHAARVLATIFESSSVAKLDWVTSEGLLSLLADGYSDSTDVGAELIPLPKDVNWTNTEVLRRAIPPAWMTAITGAASSHDIANGGTSQESMDTAKTSTAPQNAQKRKRVVLLLPVDDSDSSSSHRCVICHTLCASHRFFYMRFCQGQAGAQRVMWRL